MPYAMVPDGKIHYETSGDGERTLLLLMGLGGHASEWGEAFPAALAQRHRVVRMDNRGIGESKTQASRWTMQDMAQDALAVLDALGVNSAYVLGTSMGGMIAQVLALEHAQRVQRLVLMSTAFGGKESVGPEPAAAALFAPAPGVSAAEQRRRTLATITGPGFAEKNGELIERYVEMRGRAPTSAAAFAAQFQAILASDRSASVANIRTPTLVLHGTRDSLVPVQNGKLLAARIPNAQLVLLEDCGHMLHFESPAETARIVLKFLDGQ